MLQCSGKEKASDLDKIMVGDNMANQELLELSIEARKLSDQIGVLKRKKNLLEEGPEKNKIREEIKALQYQALFYLEKMDNLKEQA